MKQKNSRLGTQSGLLGIGLGIAVVTIGGGPFGTIGVLYPHMLLHRQSSPPRTSYAWMLGIERPVTMSKLSSLVIKGVVQAINPPVGVTVVRGPHEAIDVVYRDVIIGVQEMLRKPTGVFVGPDVVVRIFGGTAGKFSFPYGEEADFSVGEQTLLFLSDQDYLTHSQGPSHWMVTGLYRGKFTVTPENTLVRGHDGKVESLSFGQISQALKEQPYDSSPH